MSVTTAETTDEGSWVGSFITVDGSKESQAPISFSVRPKHNVIGTGSNLSASQMCLTMKAREIAEDDDKRSPVAIAVILDVSGSMGGDKLRLCKRTLDLLLRALGTNDYFCLISFSTNARVDIPIQKMTVVNKQRAAAKVTSLRAEDMTNLSAAIGLGFQEMRAVDDPNVVRGIFLLTDGHANAGITDSSDLLKLTRNCLHNGDVPDNVNPQTEPKGFFSWIRKNSDYGNADAKPAAVEVKEGDGTPPSLFCFGYGADHNADLLQKLSSITQGGMYYFIEDEENVGSAFGDALGGIMSVVAQNVVATIRVPPEAADLGVAITRVFHDHAIKRADGHYTVNAGDFYAEESRDIIFETTLAAPAQEVPSTAPIPHATVTLAYTDTIKKTPVETDPVVCALSRPAGSHFSPADDHVSAQWVRVFAARQMEEANELARANDLVAAKARISAVKELIAEQGTRVREHAEVDQLSLDLKELDVGLQSQSVYAAFGHASLSKGTQQWRTQRCNASTLSADTYGTSYKKKFALKLSGKK